MSIFFWQAGPCNAYSRGRPRWSIPLRLGGAAGANSYRRIRANCELRGVGAKFALREKTNFDDGRMRAAGVMT